MFYLVSRGRSFALASIAVLAFGGASTSALTIVPTFDTSITSSPNSAAMMSGINAAITQMQSHLLNPVTVNIKFVSDESVGLGQSSTFIGSTTFAAYRNNLLTQQTLSANDSTAIASIGAGPNNPVNNDPNVILSLPLFRALGQNVNPPASQPDSTISFKMSLMNFVRTGTQDPNKYDLEQVALHEITEVMGAGGGGSQLGNAGAVGTLDLYRYSAANTRSYSTSATSAYFSINSGTTNLSYFNQTAGGDYADWNGTDAPFGNPTAQVQDAFSSPGFQLDLSTNELTALDIVGWNVSVPNPLPWAPSAPPRRPRSPVAAETSSRKITRASPRPIHRPFSVSGKMEIV